MTTFVGHNDLRKILLPPHIQTFTVLKKSPHTCIGKLSERDREKSQENVHEDVHWREKERDKVGRRTRRRMKEEERKE